MRKPGPDLRHNIAYQRLSKGQEGEVNVIRKMLAAAALVVLASCNAPDPNAPADGAAVKNPPVDANPSPKSGTGGDMPVDAGGGASTAGKGKTQ
jgi:hypothetical protein